MTVVLDTNVLPGMFTVGHRYRPILLAWMAGKFTWALSSETLCEYEEVLISLMGSVRTAAILRQIEAVAEVLNNLQQVSPTYRFQVIPNDPDDNKFADCAIVAQADFVITEDRHFRPMEGSGYKPQPIAPEEFITRFLAN